MNEYFVSLIYIGQGKVRLVTQKLMINVHPLLQINKEISFNPYPANVENMVSS
jgi:hypothetical protein